jgi:carbonic anhydrase
VNSDRSAGSTPATTAHQRFALPSLARRALLRAGLTGAAALGTTAALGTDSASAAPATTRASGRRPSTPEEALRELAAGNQRWRTYRERHPDESPAVRQSLTSGQHPFAVVLGCIDSRVPPELVFDQGLGDLFTVRAVGEVLDDAVVGSIEYAVEHLHVPLVVILGHSGCGAVKAAIALARGHSEVTGAVDTVARAIEATVRATPPDHDEARFLAACVRNQTTRVAEELTARSQAAPTTIVTAVYDLATGRVNSH